MRARVFAETYPSGRVWVYEVYEPNRPLGDQLKASGTRDTWGDALEAAGLWVNHKSPVRSPSLSSQWSRPARR